MKNKNMLWFFLIMAVSFYIASAWEKVPVIKDSVSAVLDPTLGALLNWSVIWGFVLIVALTALILTLSQKFLSDQEKLRDLKSEQKALQEEMKKYKDNPEKLMEFQKQQLEFIPKTFDLTLKPIIYTAIPIILLFRWFGDHLQPVFGGWWIFYYLVGSIIFSSIFRKAFKVA